MKGQLTAQPLAELIREISEKSLSGALRLERERAQVIIYFDKGQVVYAAANLKTLRLRELVKRNLATEAELATLPSNPSDLVLASAFTSSGKVKQKDMDALLAVLVTDVLRVALLWTEGAWEFNERGQLADSIRVTVDPVSLMREAIQRWRTLWPNVCETKVKYSRAAQTFRQQLIFKLLKASYSLGSISRCRWATGFT